MNTMGYSSIPSTDGDDVSMDSDVIGNGHAGPSDPTKARPATMCGNKSLIVILTGIILTGIIGLQYFRGVSIYNSNSGGASSSSKALPFPGIPMPKGVNLGSWLSLEDYFYIGPTGAVEVATPDDKIAGQCLPPLHTGPSTGPMWHSETDLYGNLTTMEGGSVRDAIRIFHGFRAAYLDWDEELSQIASLGIERVRVPISWCFTDHDPSNDDILNRDDDGELLGQEENDELERRFTCLDPFFAEEGTEVRWPAIPRPFLASFLRACSKYGLKATLDIHTYPGGTSLGTFSGVWPRKPLFWKYDDPENSKEDVGRNLLRDFFAWIESLEQSDPEAFAGVGGITPMNEPAHLAGLFGPGANLPASDSFLPSLPKHLAKSYLGELESSGSNTFTGDSKIVVPDGPHLRMLMWQRDAIDIFRSTTLPQNDIGLYANVHESVFTPSLVPEDANDDEKMEAVTAIFGSWWEKSTTPEERSSAVLLDMHRYHAWSKSCSGAIDGPPTGNYTCGDESATDETLGRCARWAGMYRRVMDEQLGEGSRLISAEFSASTHHSVLHSCTDTTTLRKTYMAQVNAANEAGVELFWWSWKMPHGGAFRPAWSFKHFLHRLGVDGFGPDESEVVCGV